MNIIERFKEWRRFRGRRRHFRKRRAICMEYVSLGCVIGDALSYSYLGEPVGLLEDAIKLASFEEKIIEMGFEPFTMLNFGDAGGWSKDAIRWRRRCSNNSPARIFLEKVKKNELRFGDLGSKLMVLK